MASSGRSGTESGSEDKGAPYGSNITVSAEGQAVEEQQTGSIAGPQGQAAQSGIASGSQDPLVPPVRVPEPTQTGMWLLQVDGLWKVAMEQVAAGSARQGFWELMDKMLLSFELGDTLDVFMIAARRARERHEYMHNIKADSRTMAFHQRKLEEDRRAAAQGGRTWSAFKARPEEVLRAASGAS